ATTPILATPAARSARAARTTRGTPPTTRSDSGLSARMTALISFGARAHPTGGRGGPENPSSSRLSSVLAEAGVQVGGDLQGRPVPVGREARPRVDADHGQRASRPGDGVAAEHLEPERRRRAARHLGELPAVEGVPGQLLVPVVEPAEPRLGPGSPR